MRRLLRRLAFLLRPDDLADELESHRLMKQDALRRSGMPEAEIRSTTQRALGNDLLARERARDVWVSPALADVSQDIKSGLRMLVTDRRFAITAIVTLALGMAVSQAVFAFVNATILHDLPFEAPHRLLTVRTIDPRGFNSGVSWLEFQEWRRDSTVFESIAADLNQSVNVSDAAHAAERLSGAFISATTFRTLGVTPSLGRDFADSDDDEGATPVTIISHGMWTTRYGGEASVLGRIIRINEQPATVIGVMPERFAYPLVTDLWIPMHLAPNLRSFTWASTSFGVAGRLKPGAEIAQARAEVEAIGTRLARDHRELTRDRRVVVLPLKEGTLAPDAVSLMMALLGGAVVVLFVASANVATLLLARSWRRSREIAVRLALGATRWRVVRQVLIECALIGVAASALGSYLSWLGFTAMAAAFNVVEFGAPDRPRKVYWFNPDLDGAVWLFGGAVFMFATLGVGIIPALHLSRARPTDVLKDGRLGAATRSSRRWAAALMVGQIAVAVMLLVSGGLFARSFFALYGTSPVIGTRDLVAMRLTLSSRKYATPEQRREFFRLLEERIDGSGVFAESTIASEVPIQPLTAATRLIAVEGRAIDPGEHLPRATYLLAGRAFFETLRFPIVRGRALNAADGAEGSPGVVVNERAAAALFGNDDPLGRRITLTTLGAQPVTLVRTIVGIAPTLPDYLPNQPDEMAVYAPLRSEPSPPRGISVIARSTAKAEAAAALRNEVSTLDPDLPVHAVQSLDEMLALTRAGARMVGSWFQTLAVIAVVLACVGLYALTAHGVGQRTAEIGVRMALGARAGQVIMLFMRQTFTLLAIGLALGIAGALASTRLLATFLSDVNPRDPGTFITGAVALSVIAGVAGAIPARRAARIDPVQAIRTD
jgi:predicted permease